MKRKKKDTTRQESVTEMFDALRELEKTKGIPVDYMLEQIQRSITIACKNNYGGNEDVVFTVEPEQGEFRVFLRKTVVEEVENPNWEVDVQRGRELDIHAGIGDKVKIELDPRNLGRIAVQTARTVIRQGIRDGERGQMLAEFRSKCKEIVTATVESIDPTSGAATIKIGKSTAVLPKAEQLGVEDIAEGDYVKVYILDVKESEKGPRAVLSRTHADFVRRLVEAEVPEVFDGTVEIKSVAREAGSRTKIAVWSKDDNVDAVGSCIGTRGTRVAAVVEELGGEKIDIIGYKENPEEYVAAALSPATVLKVEVLDEETRTCRATVPDGQLSLAIGNKGQNARLAAKLTGWKIDIRPESGFYGEDIPDEQENTPSQEKHDDTPPAADTPIDSAAEDESAVEEAVPEADKSTEESAEE